MTTGKSGPDCVWVRARQKYSLPRTYHTPALFHISNDRSERWFSALFCCCCCCCSRRRRLTVLMVLVSETSSLYLERSQCIISFVALFIKSVISNSMTNKVIIKSWAQSFYIDECCALSTVWAPQASNLWERVCLCVFVCEWERARERDREKRKQRGQIYASEILILLSDYYFYYKFVVVVLSKLIQILVGHKLESFACGRTFI